MEEEKKKNSSINQPERGPKKATGHKKSDTSNQIEMGKNEIRISKMKQKPAEILLKAIHHPFLSLQADRQPI